MTINNFVKLALKQSDDARNIYINYENSVFSYKSSYRASRLPSASLSSSISRSKTETDITETYKDGADGSVSLSQPVYPTGGSISASVSQSVSTTETGSSFSRRKKNPSYSASLSQPIFLFVGNSEWRSWKRTQINMDIADDDFKRSLQELENEARSKYFDVVRQREQVGVEKHKLKSSERAHRITKLMVKAGRQAGIEKSRSEVRFKRDQRRLENAQTQFEKTKNEALEFIGMDIGSKHVFSSKLTYNPLSIPLKKLISFAFLNRPDYKAAGRRLELSELSVVEAREADNVRLDATGSLSKTSTNDGSNDFNSKSWDGKLQLSWAFFDSRRTHLNVLTAKNNHEKEQISFKGLKRNIETEVTNAYLDVKRAERRIDDLRQSRTEARKTVEVVRIRYKNGVDRLVDVFDSENELRDIELEYLDALISANVAKDNLALQIGGRLEDLLK